MNCIKNSSMKKVFALIAVAVMMLSCGGNGQNGTNEKDVNGSGAKISIGDKFAFAGLESDQLVPDFAVELSELETDPRSESKPMKDEVFFYTGPDITAIPATKVQTYLQNVYSTIKTAADGGVIYKAKGISGDELGELITTPPSTDKPATTVMYLYQYDGTWFNITVGHKAYFRKFKKDYGEKFIGVGITVKEMLGEVN